MLETQLLDATGSGSGTPVLVLMHGRGADPSDLAGLRGWLPEEVALVLPRAPFSGDSWGYGPGWAWYRYEGGDRPEEQSFRASQTDLERLIEDLPAVLGYEPGPTVVGGFSQGGTMGIGYALRKPGAVAGVLNLSGFLPSHPDVPVTPEAVRGQRFFWGHGTADPAVPFALAERGRAALKAAGAELHVWSYPMGHGITRPEVEEAVGWLTSVILADDGAPHEGAAPGG